MSTEKRKCKKCAGEFPLTDFPMEKSYHRHDCKTCYQKYQTTYMTMWRNVKRKKYNDYMRKYMAERREAKQ